MNIKDILMKELLRTKSFLELPIVFDETELLSYRDGSWYRTVKRTGTISELLDTWDIDDQKEDDAMAQVLRYLREAMQLLNEAKK